MNGLTLERAGGTAVARVLAAVRSRAGVDAAFAARVQPDGKAMTILQVCGGLTRSLSGLTIASGAGLGGKSLVLGRPVQVDDYLTARGITHNYDQAVTQERLQTVAALPVRVANIPRYVVYVGTRGEKSLGDRWLDALAPLMRDLEHEIAVSEEVERRLRSLTPAVPAPRQDPGRSVLSAGELREVAGELAELAGAVRDDAVRERLQALHDRFAPCEHEELMRRDRDQAADVGLTPREVAVLEQVALGGTNADVAAALGLLHNTVKSYLKSAMRKLGASNRVQAIVEARSLGILP
jgi:DNA-binding CsgD family transcriptional regulator